jgi:hypothetical protein
MENPVQPKPRLPRGSNEPQSPHAQSGGRRRHEGGGIASTASTPTLSDFTIANNSADDGGWQESDWPRNEPHGLRAPGSTRHTHPGKPLQVTGGSRITERDGGAPIAPGFSRRGSTVNISTAATEDAWEPSKARPPNPVKPQQLANQSTGRSRSRERRERLAHRSQNL